MRSLGNYDFQQVLVHTGQHYDANMSEVFFKQLGLPVPDINLEVGAGSHAVQTARIMTKLEMVLLEETPDLVLVYGDVNSTVAAALVCAKLGVPVGHVEAGLRSLDRTMPEEINRIVTDQLADLLFTPSVDGNENLLREGVSRDKVFLVGNVMIDTLVRLKKKAARTFSLVKIAEQNNFPNTFLDSQYALVTLHRPSNVDDPVMLLLIMKMLKELSEKINIVFPIHPRTRNKFQELHIKTSADPGLILTDPLGYLEFLTLQKNAKVVITDSGGIQEETTFLGVPCLTLRENTERPVTVTEGTNILVGKNMYKTKTEVWRILDGNNKKGSVPCLWDGRASERLANVIYEYFYGVGATRSSIDMSIMFGPRNDEVSTRRGHAILQK
jgi:UDP-N-acetylglucosamine 2-epimerase (non-hydrolysing)